MPINLIVDEAYAFDYLSILEVKYKKNPSSKNETNIKNCMINLHKEVKNFPEIHSSHEYAVLREINQKVFEAIDILKNRDISASVVDNLNYQRFLAKQKLQEKFFPQNNLQEVKIGYS